MAFNERSAETMELTLHSMAQGQAFVMEQGRLNHLAGVMTSRQANAERMLTESGSGQARAFLPGGKGCVPTAV